MRHASKLAHLHAFSCMHEECMHASGMHESCMKTHAGSACMLKFGDSDHRQQSRFRVRGS